MTKTMKDASKVKHSNRTSTPECESVNLSEKQYDFSKFNEFFTERISPDKAIKHLDEMRLSYMETSLYVLMDMYGIKPIKVLPHKDVRSQVALLSDLINLIKSVFKNS